MFDTNIISYTMKHPATLLAERYRATPTANALISSVVEAELRYGVARLPREARLHGLIDAALSSLIVVPWDSACAQAHAVLRAGLQRSGHTMSYADTMIAAHSIARGETLVTNDRAFGDVPGLQVQFWNIEAGHAYK